MWAAFGITRNRASAIHAGSMRNSVHLFIILEITIFEIAEGGSNSEQSFRLEISPTLHSLKI